MKSAIALVLLVLGVSSLYLFSTQNVSQFSLAMPQKATVYSSECDSHGLFKNETFYYTA
jgi:hypothetical protein